MGACQNHPTDLSKSCPILPPKLSTTQNIRLYSVMLIAIKRLSDYYTVFTLQQHDYHVFIK